MATRTIEAPGIEVNEIDRSQYGNQTDNVLPNAPTCLICGFADKGDDYAAYNITTKNDLAAKYGYPLTEAERYFYNGCLDIIRQGGKLITCKLPYDNNSKDMFTYVDYYIDPLLHLILEDLDIIGKWKTVNDVRDVLDDIVQLNTVKDILLNDKILTEATGIVSKSGSIDLTTLPNMRQVVKTILTSTKYSEAAYNELRTYDDNVKNTVRSQLITLLSSDYAGYDSSAGEVVEDKSLSAYIINKCDEELDSVYFTELVTNATKENSEVSDMQKLVGSCIYQKVDNPPRYKNTKTINAFQTQFKDINLGCQNFLHFYNQLDTYVNIQTVTALQKAILSITNAINNSHPYSDLKVNDSNITSYVSIDPINQSGKITMEQLDDYLTNDYTEIKNKIRIVNITRNKFEKTNFNSVETVQYSNDTEKYVSYTNDCLGIVPVIVSPTNALFFLNKIEDANYRDYNGIVDFKAINPDSSDINVLLNTKTVYDNLYVELSSSDNLRQTLSKIVSEVFPDIKYDDNGHYKNDYFKQIGIVVLTAYTDNANNGKLNFSVLESFIGSLDKNCKSTGDASSIFIDNVVNNNSKYIRCFSNANSNTVKQSSIIALKNQQMTSLGFYEYDCKKNIEFTNSIEDPLKKIFTALGNTYSTDIDLVIDAGVTNISQYLIGDNSYESDNTMPFSSSIELNSRPYGWFKIAKMFDNFVKYTRKDCMFLLDCPRPFCLEGNQKIVRKTRPLNSITDNIVPKLKYLTGINSSYTAGYCNWFKVKDDYSGDYFWCPPSIKAAKTYCYTDEYFHMWDAPAGMNRGIVDTAYDIAFNPTNEEAGKIYSLSWNYAASYQLDGIVLEGQKTFQIEKTALDRINVRRLMLYLEKSTVRIAKYYLYEGNTSYLRSKFVNALMPVFEKAVNGYGISDYVIKCDDDNNTSETIDRNELHCSIAVKPVKTVEFIVLNFIVTNQSAILTEEIKK